MVVIQILAFRRKVPVGKPDLHNAAVGNAEERVVIAVDEPDAVILFMLMNRML